MYSNATKKVLTEINCKSTLNFLTEITLAEIFTPITDSILCVSDGNDFTSGESGIGAADYIGTDYVGTLNCCPCAPPMTYLTNCSPGKKDHPLCQCKKSSAEDQEEESNCCPCAPPMTYLTNCSPGKKDHPLCACKKPSAGDYLRAPRPTWSVIRETND